MNYDPRNLEIIASLRKEESLLQVAKQKLSEHQGSQHRSFIHLGELLLPEEDEPIYIGIKIPSWKEDRGYSAITAIETSIFEYFADTHDYIVPAVIVRFEGNGLYGALMEDLTRGGLNSFMEGGRHRDIPRIAEIFQNIEPFSDESFDLHRCSVEVHGEFVEGIGSYSHSALIDFDHMIRLLKEPYKTSLNERKDNFLSDSYLIPIG